jgi:hypothetical protein
MSGITQTDPVASPFTTADSAPERLGTAEARVLLRECFAQFKSRLLSAARMSLDMSTDLFEWNSRVPESEVARFRASRGAWLERFGQTIEASFERRMAGERRKGRRPDSAETGVVAGVAMLSDFDQDKQAALVAATQHIDEYTRREVAALDARFAALVSERGHADVDNPFSPAYVLDAVGATSRAIFSDARIWRPLMERLLADITPGLNNIYIGLNRMLSAHGVLPEIGAELRARSDLRPVQDTELLPAFKRLLANAAGAAAAQTGRDAAHDRLILPAATIVACLHALATGGGAVEAGAEAEAGAFPDLDPLLALGGTAATIKRIGALQRIDLPTEILREAQRSFGAGPDARVPGNLVPYVGDMLAPTLENPGERAAIDVVALIFDYAARDGSIPPELRPLFARLQVPMLKAALLDPAFFHDSRNPARHVLDHLAAASIGASDDETYGNALRLVAGRLIDGIVEHFDLDPGVFATAAQQLALFADLERQKTAAAIAPDIDTGKAAERDEADRGRVRALVRDRLAGGGVPAPVRGFIETTWTDYLTQLRLGQGESSVAAGEALQTLDDLLWSVVAKERTAQKTRLARMIPGLVANLRKGCAVLAVPQERVAAFLDNLYALHIAAIKVPVPDASLPGGAPTAGAVQESDAPRPPSVLRGSIHDFVNEMIAGTWLTFQTGPSCVTARLAWTGALRMRYVFASRLGTHVFVYTPEELAHALSTGSASLLLEPVSLFDRAVSFALNALAARKPADADRQAPAFAA